MKRTGLSRRGFLKGVLAAGAAPLVLPSDIVYGATAPSNRVNLASIGVGGQGGALFNTLLAPEWIRVVAVADCFQERRESRARQAKEKYGGDVCRPYRDFREILARPDVDGVVVATPDHWHHHATALAMQAGKDVYCEKPLTLTIDDNKDLLETARRYGRIFQYGTQQRSSTHIRVGCELVRAGVLGKLSRIEVEAFAGQKGGSLEPAPVPEGLDYEMWLGPSRDRPYTKDRCIGKGAYFSTDCSIGFIAGWGAHPLDVMTWALGDGPDSVPVSFEGKGEFGAGLYDACTTWDVKGRFASGVEFGFTSASGDCTTFIGERGRIMISRGYLKAEPAGLLREPLPPRRDPLRANTTGFHHTADFAQCIRTREQPCSPIEAAYHSDNISHLSLIAIKTGRKIVWDLGKQTVVGDDEARRMMGRKVARYPYVV